MNSANNPADEPGWRRVLASVLSSRTAIVAAGFVVVLTMFYAEENWRGKLAWERCRRELEAKGETLDWRAFLPPLIADDQNIFEAPNMKSWFAKDGQGNLSTRLRPSTLYQQGNSNIVANITVISPVAIVEPGAADLVLVYDDRRLTLASEAPIKDQSSDPIIPLIVMDEVPLTDAIKNLARQAELNYVLDPRIPFAQAGPDGRPVPQPSVSLRWEDITARKALVALLANYDLVLIQDSRTRISRITPAEHQRIQVELPARRRIEALIQDALMPASNGAPCLSLKGSQEILLLDQPLVVPQPAKFFIRAPSVPSPAELAQLFPANGLVVGLAAGSPLRVEFARSNRFRLRLGMSPCPADQYLAWSDRFIPDFNAIRTALERPQARLSGNYSEPDSMPMVNFVAIRNVAQTLSQRAQSFLLSGQPEQALHELTLLHDLGRLLQAKPRTVVSSMIHVAITGLYTEVITDGFRLQAWREPELLALQQQLEQINLVPELTEAFLTERAGVCRTLETTRPDNLKGFLAAGAKPTFAHKLQNPELFLFAAMPHGWNRQNMATIAKLDQVFIKAFDPGRQIVVPHELDRAADATCATFERFSPDTFLAAMAVPNFTRACQVLAWNQTKVNEARIACALERYRLAHGSRPEMLTSLVPRFIQDIPCDLIKGESLRYHASTNGSFRLYSIGWNEKDDGGDDPRETDRTASLNQGDWAWSAPRLGLAVR